MSETQDRDGLAELHSIVQHMDDRIERIIRMQHVILHATLASQSSTLAETAMEFLRETSTSVTPSLSCSSPTSDVVTSHDKKRVKAVVGTLVTKMKQLIALSQPRADNIITTIATNDETRPQILNSQPSRRRRLTERHVATPTLTDQTATTTTTTTLSAVAAATSTVYSSKRARREADVDAELLNHPPLDASMQKISQPVCSTKNVGSGTGSEVARVTGDDTPAAVTNAAAALSPEIVNECIQFGHTAHGVVFRHVAILLSCLGYTVMICDTNGVRFVRNVPEFAIDVFFGAAVLQPYHNRYAFGARVDSAQLLKACTGLKRKNACSFFVDEALSTLTFTIKGATSAINEQIPLSQDYRPPHVDQCSTSVLHQLRTTIEELQRVCKKLITDNMDDIVIKGGVGWMAIGVVDMVNSVCRIGCAPENTPCEYEHVFDSTTFLHIAKVCNINRGNAPIILRPGPNFTFITKAAAVGVVTISIASRDQTAKNAEAISKNG